MLRQNGREEEVGGGQRRVPTQVDLKATTRARGRGRPVDGLFRSVDAGSRKGIRGFGEEMDGGLCGYLGDGGEPSKVEERRGAGGPGQVADEEGGLGEVELGGDGLHPPLVRGVVVVEEAHRGGVALERLGREGVHHGVSDGFLAHFHEHGVGGRCSKVA